MPKLADGRRRNGRTPRGLNPVERFMIKTHIDPVTRCWVWTGAIEKHSGYASFTASTGQTKRGYRWAYETFVGEVPDGLHLDHLCRNRACVNPWHLEPVTPLENTRRGEGHGKETHCPQDHPYDEVNTYHHGGRRYCKTCTRERARLYNARKRAEARAA